MRHTLLPINERKSLRRDYSLRLAIVLGLLMSFSGIVGVVALFPAYLTERGEERSALDAAAQSKRTKDQNGQTAIENELRANAVFLNRLALDGDPVRPSSIISNVISLRGDMKLTSFSIEKMSTSSVTIVVQGNAPTRDGMLAFKSRLEKSLPNSSVLLPISELAKIKNIQFSMKITYNNI